MKHQQRIQLASILFGAVDQFRSVAGLTAQTTSDLIIEALTYKMVDSLEVIRPDDEASDYTWAARRAIMERVETTLNSLFPDQLSERMTLSVETAGAGWTFTRVHGNPPPQYRPNPVDTDHFYQLILDTYKGLVQTDETLQALRKEILTEHTAGITDVTPAWDAMVEYITEGFEQAYTDDGQLEEQISDCLADLLSLDRL